MKYEVYLNSTDNRLIIEDRKTGVATPLDQMEISFFLKADDAIKAQYPETYERLVDIHKHQKEFAFARVKNFFACNFSIKDGKPDIDEDWNFNLEAVPCPARMTGICKGGICFPKLTSELSAREIEVLRLFSTGFSEEEIADSLFISPATIHNHINNMYKKIDLVGKSSPDRKLINYAHRRGLV